VVSIENMKWKEASHLDVVSEVMEGGIRRKVTYLDDRGFYLIVVLDMSMSGE